jgi:hypothetical protein
MNNLKLYFFILGLSLVFSSCSKESDSTTNPVTDKNYNVKYEVKMLNGGAVKVTYKTPAANNESIENITSDWQKEYIFKNSIDSFLEVYITGLGSENKTQVKLQIYVDSLSVQDFEYSGGIGTKFSIQYKSSSN